MCLLLDMSKSKTVSFKKRFVTILDPCSHCFLMGHGDHPWPTDGPCKVVETGVCTNQGENAACSPDPERYTGFCMPRYGKWNRQICYVLPIINIRKYKIFLYFRIRNKIAAETERTTPPETTTSTPKKPTTGNVISSCKIFLHFYEFNLTI